LSELKIRVDVRHSQEQTEDSDIVEVAKAEEISLLREVFLSLQILAKKTEILLQSKVRRVQLMFFFIMIKNQRTAFEKLLLLSALVLVKEDYEQFCSLAE